MSSPRDTVVVDGKALSQQIRGELAEEVRKLAEAGRRPPCLAVVLVGDNPASASYIKGKRRACARVGMQSVERDLPASAGEADVLALVDELNRDDSIDGILVQLPLPDGVSATAVARAVDPAKDVDGLHPMNSGRLLQGVPGLYPCTPMGIIEVLDRHEIPIEGAHAVVVGRSEIVGKPVSLLLLHRHATVTICHSRTRDLPGVCREADILVAAVGRARMIQPDWVKPGAAVIDVGVNEVDGKLVGDVDFDGVQGIAGLVTPPRGGVGPMTITMLLRNTLQAYREHTGA
ncbi:MAG: bifunctional methylenetetrahydrofolate dehydrogenase/methenyltetrahydrofolate cyclohydrolase FolD [Deltaproteobacteria bacterium]|nr:bifunctional methylenetetrahydrofolate dehydrogenase/methenyltetrahydrofolate cyclohydrolase FolD [Deltaproteobacteria bacterium]MBW2372139.1 bifunctional methylenetetrahydrofolate dehydrogenase/methenyltetrahydrofolate cyclohydrolase FolD [Deltaproteobacteria bacterium]